MLRNMFYEGPDPSSHDFFICYHCSYKMPRGDKAIHRYDETPDTHWPSYKKTLSFAQQLDLFDYDVRLSDKYGERVGMFLSRRAYEDKLGIRDPDQKLLVAGNFSLNFEFLSIRTDGTDYPMFQEEIEDWLVTLRREFNFPKSCLETTLPCGNTYKNTLTQLEVLILCLWMQEQKVGAGSQMLSGRLITRKDKSTVDEQEVEDAWDN